MPAGEVPFQGQKGLEEAVFAASGMPGRGDFTQYRAVCGHICPRAPSSGAEARTQRVKECRTRLSLTESWLRPDKFLESRGKI